MLAYYLHNLNPIIFHLGPITPRWYGFAYLLGFFFAYLLLLKQARDGMLRLPLAKVPDFVLNGCIFGVLVGGRLGYVLFYDLPQSFREHYTPLIARFSSSFPYWGLLEVNNGGMSAHGGIVATILTLIFFTWHYNRSLEKSRRLHPNQPLPPKASLVNIGDAACMVVPIGLCFGRIANFINGELYGHATSLPWAVQFPSEIYAPTNGVLDPSVQAALPALTQSHYHTTDIDFAMRSLTTDLQNHVPAAMNAVRNILPPRHPSQLYEALLEGVVLFLLCYTIGRLWKKDGMASGAFLTFYPIMRIIGEQFRVGDHAVVFANLSAGVLYSLAMLLPALLYWLYWIKRNRRIPWTPQHPQPSPPPSPSNP
jgi:phosphatidylglycerol:prolipoprotein diacylglycerol transferase